uniref:Serpin domain-containing protein n=1 Tax=Oryzias latipes TaxID=8090 RepID=A0A3B3IPY8_ORYLA
TALFWTERSEVFPGMCCSHSSSLGVIAPSAPITTDTTVTFNFHALSISSLSPWYFFSFSCSFFLMFPSTTNIFFSPFSISSALAMVMLGARGDTATQMAECLKTQDCQEEVHSLFQQLLEELNKPRAGFLLSVANRLYGEQSFLFLQVKLESVDFRNKYEEARIKINSWVEKQTQGGSHSRTISVSHDPDVQHILEQRFSWWISVFLMLITKTSYLSKFCSFIFKTIL